MNSIPLSFPSLSLFDLSHESFLSVAICPTRSHHVFKRFFILTPKLSMVDVGSYVESEIYGDTSSIY
jgi:hypothetical protein